MVSTQYSPAAERNLAPILQTLQALLPATGRALEVASGTGQHVAGFAAALPGWTWQPSDHDPANLESIAAWAAQAGVRNVLAPVPLDVRAARWPGEAPAENPAPWDLVYCANLLHIAPWDCCAALVRGAARTLAPHGLLVTYGPYLEGGVPTRARQPGLRCQPAPAQPGLGPAPAGRRGAAGSTGRPAAGRAPPPAGKQPAAGVHAPAAGQHARQCPFHRALNAMPALSSPSSPSDLSPLCAPFFTARTADGSAQCDAWPDQPLLLSLEQGGIDWPSSCRNGTCRTCIGHLVSGSVRHAIAWPGLSAEELAAGCMLPCVAHPTSDVVLQPGEP